MDNKENTRIKQTVARLKLACSDYYRNEKMLPNKSQLAVFTGMSRVTIDKYYDRVIQPMLDLDAFDEILEQIYIRRLQQALDEGTPRDLKTLIECRQMMSNLGIQEKAQSEVINITHVYTQEDPRYKAPSYEEVGLQVKARNEEKRRKLKENNQ